MATSDALETERKMQSLTKSSDLREDMATAMTPYASWEDYIIHAPMCIAIIGQLMCISTSTQEDFSLELSKRKDGKSDCIRYPESFKACLQQVANDVSQAFNKAHNNMDAIRLKTNKVPGHLDSATDILFKGTREDIEDLLPTIFNRIKTTSDESKELAEEVEKKFGEVIDVIDELLLASEAAKNSYNDKQKIAEIQKKNVEDRKQAVKEEEKRNEELFKQISESFKKAEESYYKYMDELPGGFKLIGMQILEDTFQAASGLIGLAGIGAAKKLTQGAHFLHSIFAYASVHSGTIKSVAQNITSSQAGASTQPEKQKDPENKNYIVEPMTPDGYQAYVKSFHLQQPTSALMHLKHGETIAVPPDAGDPVKLLMSFKNMFNDTVLAVQSLGDSEPKKKIRDICKDGGELCDELMGIFKNLPVADEHVKKDLARRIHNLDESVKSLITESYIMLKIPPLQNNAPGEAQQLVNSQSMSSKDYAVQQAKFKLSSATEHLEHTRTLYDKVCDDRKKVAEDMKNIMQEMAKLKLDQKDFDGIRKALKEGIQAFHQLKEKWAKLVNFFQVTSKLIKMCSAMLHDFLEITKNTQKRSCPLSAIRKKIINKIACEGANYANLVHMMAEAYVDVSNKYLMHKIAGVGHILSYDYGKDKEKIEQERKKLFLDCEAAQADIMEEIKERKRQFNTKVEKRLKALQEAMPATDDASS